MGQELIGVPVRGVTPYAGDAVWERNGGIYLGLQAFSPTTMERDFPLDGQDRIGAVENAAAIKSWWMRTGAENLYVGNRHIVTVGPNGSGKTRKLLLPNLYRLHDWSCVVIDPKGELCAHTAVHRASQQGHRVIVVDPYGVMKRVPYENLYKQHLELLTSRGFNPLAALNPKSDSFVDDARKIAVALVKTDKARDPYWTMAAQALIEGLILGLKIEFGDKADLNLLRQVLSSSPDELAKNYVVPTLSQFAKNWPAVKASLGEFTKCSPDDRELSGIRRTARTHTNWLDSKPMQADLKGTAFDAASMKTTPTTVYVVLPPAELEDKSCWLRLMVTSLLMPLMRSVGPAPVPVMFMLDEAAALGHMEIIKNNYAMLRGYGVKLWTVWQGLKQVSDIYGDWWENLLGNAGVTQSYAPQDMTTREYLSRLSGTRQRIYMSHSSNSSSGFGMGQGAGFSGNMGTSSSINEQRMSEAVIKPHELAALDDDETVIYHRRGKMHLSVCPQPEYLEGVSDALRKARTDIGGGT